MEHLLFAACLENASYALAEEAMAALAHTFYDWNEVRVSSVRELAEVLAGLPEASAAAMRVKRVLQSVFETTYSFDMEELRKQNLGPAVERVQKIEGTTKFSVAYLVQSALGGHAIPCDSGTLTVLRLLDLVSDADVHSGEVPGVERAIAKNCGVEFGSLLHQVAADFTANPFAPAVRAILKEIDSSVEARLPVRRVARHESVGSTPVPAEEKGKKSSRSEKTEKVEKKEKHAPAAAEPEVAKPRAESPAEKREAVEPKKKHEVHEPKKKHESAEAKPEPKKEELHGAKKKEEPAPVKKIEEPAELKKKHPAHETKKQEQVEPKKHEHVEPKKEEPSGKKKPVEEVHAKPAAPEVPARKKDRAEEVAKEAAHGRQDAAKKPGAPKKPPLKKPDGHKAQEPEPVAKESTSEGLAKRKPR